MRSLLIALASFAVYAVADLDMDACAAQSDINFSELSEERCADELAGAPRSFIHGGCEPNKCLLYTDSCAPSMCLDAFSQDWACLDQATCDYGMEIPEFTGTGEEEEEEVDPRCGAAP